MRMSDLSAPQWCHVSLKKPSYLPDVFWSICLHMNFDGKLYDERYSFIFSEYLKDFWSNKKLHQLDLNYASTFLGCFFIEKDFYGEYRAGGRPRKKSKIRENQKKADALMKEAAKLSGKLAGILDEIESITPHHPSELSIFEVLDSMRVEGINFQGYSDHSSIWKVETSSVLIQLKRSLDKFPRSKSIFSRTPALASQKSTEIDWLRQVIYNLDMLCTAPSWRELNIREIDWINIYRVFIEDSDSVRDRIKGVINLN